MWPQAPGQSQPPQVFTDYVNSNRIALQELHQPQREIGWSGKQGDLSDAISTMIPIFRTLTAEIFVAQNEGRYEDVALLGAAMFQFGHIASESDEMFESGASFYLQSHGLDWLRKYREHLSSAAARRVIQQLEQVEEQRVKHNDADRRIHLSASMRRIVENDWSWRGLVCADLEGLVPEHTPAFQAASWRHIERNELLRLLIVDIAIRAYRQDNGEPPQQLEQLVPKSLSHIPDEPFTYKPHDEEFSLYLGVQEEHAANLGDEYWERRGW